MSGLSTFRFAARKTCLSRLSLRIASCLTRVNSGARGSHLTSWVVGASLMSNLTDFRERELAHESSVRFVSVVVRGLDALVLERTVGMEEDTGLVGFVGLGGWEFSASFTLTNRNHCRYSQFSNPESQPGVFQVADFQCS